MTTSSDSTKFLLLRFLRYVIPSVVAMWVFSLYTMVDGLVVARFVGPVALSSVNLAAPVTSGLFAIGVIIAVGTSTRVAIAFGEKNIPRAQRLFATGWWMLLGLALLIALLGNLFLPRLSLLLGARGERQLLTMEYLRIILLFCPFMALSYYLEYMVKVDGFPFLATVGVSLSALLNIALDLLFVGVFGLGVQGAAWATGIAQVGSFLLFLSHILGKKGILRLSFSLEWPLLLHFLPLGVADFLSEISVGVIIFLMNHALPPALGEESLVAYTLVSYVSTLVSMTFMGLSQGLQPLVSHALGAKDSQTLRRLLPLGFFSTLLLGLGLSILCAHPHLFINLFLDEGELALRQLAAEGLRLYRFAYPLLGLNLLLTGLFTALALPRPAIFLSALRTGPVLGIMLLFLTQKRVWLANAASEGIIFLVGIVLVVLCLSLRKDLRRLLWI